MGSIPIRDTDYFFVLHVHDKLNHLSYFFVSLKFTIFLFYGFTILHVPFNSPELPAERNNTNTTVGPTTLPETTQGELNIHLGPVFASLGLFHLHHVSGSATS